MNIIGHGGLAGEIVAYFTGKGFYGVQHWVESEYTTNEVLDIKDLPLASFAVMAIGNPKIKQRIYHQYPHIKWVTLNQGNTYSKFDGTGAVVCPGSVVTTNIKMGKLVLINLNCTVGHDSVIGDFTTISPGANISGNVTIGKCCYIGTNAAIREGVTICDNVTIGSGAVVLNDITEPGTYVGIPVRKIQ